MTNPTVSTTETTGEPIGKHASKLKVGDWIAAGMLDGFNTEVKILSVHEHAGRVLLIFAGQTGEPLTRSLFSNQLIVLATDAEIEAARAARYRKAAAAQLADIAALFEIHDDLPLPNPFDGLHVNIHCDTVAEVELAGKLLGVEPRTTGTTTVMTTVSYPPAPTDTPSYLHQPPAKITWRSYEKPAPTAEVPAELDTDISELDTDFTPSTDTGLDYTEPDRLTEPTAATPVPAGVDGRRVGGRANFKARKP